MPENEDMIAYCGLYCADCFGYTGKIAELAKELRAELRAAKFDKIVDGIPFKAFNHYKECYEVLGALVKLKCKSACRSGGGNPFCRIRKCVQKNEHEGCWECEDFEACMHVDTLRAGHGIAHIKNLRKLNKKGVEEFLAGKKFWYVKEPSK